MNFKIYLILLLFASLKTIAGLPTEDPEVLRVQTDFMNARTPVPEELQEGKVWKCASFNAIKGHMERYSGPDYRFQKVKNAQGEEYYLETFAYEMVQNHQVDASLISFVYLFNNGMFMGNPYEDPSITRVHTYLRITADARLLVEIAAYLYPELPEQTRAAREAISVPASIFPELRLMGYDECRVED